MPLFKRTLAAAAVMLSLSAQATVTTATLPEFDGVGTFPSIEFIGEFIFSLPVGESITAATISGTFGNSSVPNTAQATLIADGIPVATCLANTACWTSQSPTSWSYTFSASQFNLLEDGSVKLYAAQTDCCVNRIGASELTITTAVPEPETYAMLLAGLGVLGFMGKRRKTQ